EEDVPPRGVGRQHLDRVPAACGPRQRLAAQERPRGRVVPGDRAVGVQGEEGAVVIDEGGGGTGLHVGDGRPGGMGHGGGGGGGWEGGRGGEGGAGVAPGGAGEAARPPVAAGGGQAVAAAVEGQGQDGGRVLQRRRGEARRAAVPDPGLPRGRGQVAPRAGEP